MLRGGREEDLTMKRKYNWISYVPAILSLLMSLGTATVFRACAAKDDGSWMHCHSAQTAAVICGIILCLVFAASVYAERAGRRSVSLVCSGIGVLGAIVTLFVPGTIISMCMMNTMRCYAVMQPFVRIMAVFIAVTALTRIFIELRGN